MCYCCCKCGLATCPADLPFSSGVRTESLELGSFGASGGDSPMGRQLEGAGAGAGVELGWMIMAAPEIKREWICVTGSR